MRRWLEGAILSGRYRPGERIVEAKVAAELNISRGPVREAIGALIRDGLLLKEPRHGAVIADFSVSDVCEIYSLRVVLESYAAQLSIRSVTQTQISILEGLLSDMRAAAEAGDREAFMDADLEFHSSLIRLPGHRRLLTLWDAIRLQVRRFMIFNERLYGDLKASAEIHVPIVEAFCSGDPARVRDAVGTHIVESGNRVIAEVVRLKGSEDETMLDIRQLLVGSVSVPAPPGPASLTETMGLGSVAGPPAGQH